MSKPHVVLGARGNTGAEITAALAEAGESVRAVSRSPIADLPTGVESIQADASDLDSLSKAVSGAAVVYHCIGMPYAKWATDLPRIMTTVIEAAASNGPQTRLVYIDNLYQYGKAGALAGPISATTPRLAKGKKGLVRKHLGEMLLSAGEAGRLKPVILQASDFFGPGATNSILHMFVVPKAVAGKRATMFARLDARHSYAYLPDIARAAVRVSLDDRATGRAWVAPHSWQGTNRDVIEAMFRAAGGNPAGKVRATPIVMLYLAAPFVPLVREVTEVAYQQYVDWIADDSEFVETFGLQPTPSERAVEETIRWYLSEKRQGEDA